MRQQHSTRQRKNKAWRVAYWPDIQRIESVPVLRTISHAWAQEYIDELSAPAARVLRYLAALNRTGTCGYIGVAVAYDLWAPQIQRATEIKFSKRSLERGIAELKALGLVETRPWVRESQYFKAGRREVEMVGAGTIKLKDGRVVVRRLSIVTLTEQALAFWEAPTCRTKTHTVGRKPSTAKMADRSSKPEKIDKSIILTKSPQTESVNVSCTEGRPTRPEPPGRVDEADQAVEHRASTPDPSPEPVSSPRKVEGREALKNDSSHTATASQGARKGCTKTRPHFDRGPHHSSDRSIAETILLAGLHDVLQKHSSRDADACYTRAKTEIGGELPKGWPTCVDWDYWLGRWPKMSPTERDIKLMREIIPELKKRYPVTPDDRKAKFVDRLQGAPPQKGKVTITDPWLAGLAARVGVGERFRT